MNLIASLIILTSFQTPGTVSQTVAPVTPAGLISKMMSNYASCTEMSGKIVLTVKVENLTQVTTTNFQFERPSKLYIYQTREDPEGGTWIVTSDGQTFSYPAPSNFLTNKGQRLFEPVSAPGQLPMNIQKIYAACKDSLVDFSVPMSISISWLDELRRIKARWLSMSLAGTGIIDDQNCYRITGDYSDSYGPPAMGQFELDINDNSEIVKYAESEFVGAPSSVKTKSAPVKVVATWDCDLKPNSKVDETLFKVLLKK